MKKKTKKNPFYKRLNITITNHVYSTNCTINTIF